MEPPLTDTSIQRIPPNNGQIFSSQNTLWQKVTPPYSGHLSTTDDKIGPVGVRYMEVPLYSNLPERKKGKWKDKTKEKGKEGKEIKDEKERKGKKEGEK